MERATSKVIIALAVFLNISGLTIAGHETCKTDGEFCGGIAGFQCCEGLVCKYEGDFPDAGGECKPINTTCHKIGELCGGFVFPPLPKCCEGLECKYDGSGAFDVPGKCRPKCVNIGEFCGGIVGTQCCEGLECPGLSGFCKPKSKTCEKVGEFCGGIAAIQCCKGLECVLDGDFPDAGGICKRGYYNQA